MRGVILYLLTLLIFAGTSTSNACQECKPLEGGLPFQDCVTNDTTVVERNGSNVIVNLDVDIATITFEWLEIKRRTYNGKLCGPTIRVKRGDTVTLRLTNSLGPDQPDQGHNKQRLPNTTNIHTHGLHISSQPPGDNVFTRVDPGESNTYTYLIDSDQPSGTYWYHAHFHGSTWFHVTSGLSGMLIVDDDVMPPELDAVSCPDNCEHDTHLLLQSTLHYLSNDQGVSFSFIDAIQEEIGDSPNFRLPEEVESYLMDPVNKFDHITVNGLYYPQLTIKQNELRRFRIVNAGGHVSLELEIINNLTAEHTCNIKEIAHDGVYHDAPRNQIQDQSFMAVAARVDWLVYCSQPGTYVLKSNPLPINKYSMGDFRRFSGDLMTIVVEESSLDEPTFPTTLPERPHFIDDLTNAVVSPENTFTVEFSDNFFINREKFVDETDYRYHMKVGTVQEWTIINTIKTSPHPLHIHVNHFQIISYNDYTGPMSEASECVSGGFVLRAQNGNVCNDTYALDSLECEGKSPLDFDEKYLKHAERWVELENNPDTAVGVVGYARKKDWRDVLQIPPLANITVRFNVDKYDGAVVAHCHVLKHEDVGMMVTFEAKKVGPIDNMDNRDLGCEEIESNSSAEARASNTPYCCKYIIELCASLLFYVYFNTVVYC